MIKYLDCSKKNYIKKLNFLLLKRPKSTKKTIKIVNKILNDVRKNGDKALLKYEKKFSNNFEIKPKKITMYILLC